MAEAVVRKNLCVLTLDRAERSQLEQALGHTELSHIDQVLWLERVREAAPPSRWPKWLTHWRALGGDEGFTLRQIVMMRVAMQDQRNYIYSVANPEPETPEPLPSKRLYDALFAAERRMYSEPGPSQQ